MGCNESSASKEGLDRTMDAARDGLTRRQEAAKMAQVEEENQKLREQLAGAASVKPVAAEAEGHVEGEFTDADLQRIEELRPIMGAAGRSAATRQTSGEAASMAAALAEKDKELQQLRTQVSNLTTRLDTAGGTDAVTAYRAEQERDVLRRQLDDLSHSAGSASAEVEALRHRAENVEERLTVREFSLRNLEAECSALKSDVTVLRGRVTDGETMRLTLQRQLDDAKADLTAARTSSTTEVTHLTADRERSATKILQLESRCQEAHTDLEEAQREAAGTRAQLQAAVLSHKTSAARVEELEAAAAGQQRDAILLKSLTQLVVGPKCTDDTLGRSIVTIACESAGLPTRVGWKRSESALKNLRFVDIPFGDSIAALSAMVIRRNPALAIIELGGSSLTDLGAGELAVSLAMARHQLEGIFLIQNLISPRGARWLVDACRTVSHRFELNMGGNPVSVASATASEAEVRHLLNDARELQRTRPNLTLEIDGL